jgi:hypothetical protein
MVKRLSDLTLEQWLAEFDSLLERENTLRGQMAAAKDEKPKTKTGPISGTSLFQMAKQGALPML